MEDLKVDSYCSSVFYTNVKNKRKSSRSQLCTVSWTHTFDRYCHRILHTDTLFVWWIPLCLHLCFWRWKFFSLCSVSFSSLQNSSHCFSYLTENTPWSHCYNLLYNALEAAEILILRTM